MHIKVHSHALAPAEIHIHKIGHALRVHSRAPSELKLVQSGLGVHSRALLDPKLLKSGVGVHLKVHSRACLDSFRT